jgi:tetratricopeptide (TPR) repeat protein
VALGRHKGQRPSAKTIRAHIARAPTVRDTLQQPTAPEERTFSLATTDFLNGRRRRAERLFQQVLKQQPQHVHALHNLGLLYLDKGMVSDAVYMLRAAVELHPNDPALLASLGLALEAAGQFSEATDRFLQALGRNSHHNAAYKDLVHCLTQQAYDAGASAAAHPKRPYSANAPQSTRPISVVICSIDQNKQERVTSSFHTALGKEDYELVVINDARSLCEGYNRGIAHSSGDILIFSHDDIEIACADFKQKLFHYLNLYDMIGVAGTVCLIDPFWGSAGWPHVHGQVIHKHPADRHYRVHAFGFDPVARPGIRAVDGLFFAVNRKVVKTIRFDEERFDGFHFYDIDFSFSAFLAGVRIAVCSDIVLVHHSSAHHLDQNWRRYAERFLEKHGAHLPSGDLDSAPMDVTAAKFYQRAHALTFSRLITAAGYRLADIRNARMRPT